jgi:3-oxoadipate enol-lactonase
MPKLELGPSLAIEYSDSGPAQAPTVLLLHGLGATRESWLLQIPAFQQAGFRVLAADARGFGRSSYPGGRLGVADMAADHAALLERLAAAPAHVVGLSMGGTTALQLAVSYPHMVRSLTLANTFAALRPHSPRGWLYFGLRLLLVHTLGIRAQALAVSRRVFPQPEQEALRQELVEQVTQAHPQAYRAAMRSLARFNLAGRLGEVRCPTLVVTGENDTTIAPRVQARLVEGIPGARQVRIAGAGHAAPVDRPAEFNHHVLEFLSQVEARELQAALPGYPDRN